MKILLVTTSARGHAIADALSRSRHKPEIIAISPSQNPGIRKLASEQYIIPVMDFDKILEIARDTKPEFAVIGPEDPIGGGLADRLMEECSIPSVAPRKDLARLESSKGFTRDLLQNYGIDASPKYHVFTEADSRAMQAFIEKDCEGEYVVKYDALKGGKGVKVSGEHLDTIDEGVAYASDCVEECGAVVIEEKLVGPEFSLISFASGTQVVNTPAIQDHKRAYEGDTGPNTGGMGTYSDADHSLPFLQPSDITRASEINQLTAKAILDECNTPFMGFLYGGFIVTKNGVKLIEYNCRLGDPEALNILPILSSDFVDICLAIVHGELRQNLVTFEKKATVCKYITPEGYPENKDQRGQEVVFPEIPENARIYYGDITEEADGKLLLGGSRTSGIVGIGDTIEEAERVAQEICKSVQGPVRFRNDIGTSDLITKKVEMMENLRGRKYC